MNQNNKNSMIKSIVSHGWRKIEEAKTFLIEPLKKSRTSNKVIEISHVTLNKWTVRGAVVKYKIVYVSSAVKRVSYTKKLCNRS